MLETNQRPARVERHPLKRGGSRSYAERKQLFRLRFEMDSGAGARLLLRRLQPLGAYRIESRISLGPSLDFYYTAMS